jgi:hypothetical protein
MNHLFIRTPHSTTAFSGSTFTALVRDIATEPRTSIKLSQADRLIPFDVQFFPAEDKVIA